MKRAITALIFVVALAGLLAAQDSMERAGERAGAGPAASASFAWPGALLDLASTIAVQEQGRIKPLSTTASFMMLRINGKRSLKIGDRKIGPTEWMLDCLFFPERARQYETILLEDRDVLDMIGLESAGHEKRGRVSHAFVAPAEATLMQLWRTYGQIEEVSRSAVQGQVIRLAQNYSELTGLLRFLEFGRSRFKAADYPALTQFFPEGEVLRASQVMAVLPALLQRFHGLGRPSGQDGPDSEAGQLQRVIQEINRGVADWSSLALVPPPEGEELWFSPGSLALALAEGHGGLDTQLEQVRRLERLVELGPRAAEFASGFAEFHAGLKQLAENRGEYGKIDLEVAYYRGDFFFRAQWLFVLGFVLTMFVALRPKSRWLYQLTRWWLVTPILVAAVGITIRCVLRSRPPVSTLYETIVFCTTVAAALAMVIEFINRRRVAQAAAALMGAAGLFLASWYEGIGGQDTMPRLQAVLDSNFWLTVHVLTIALGYSATGLLAPGLAHLYVLGRLFGFKRDDAEFYRNIARMVYGAIAFGLLFSLVGTITGGIWANESWGRFWGWDPKENGALLIVLGNLIILHARAGGYFRDFGTCLAAIALCPIVTFSWFHTNLLNVGLHAYGFNQYMYDLVIGIYTVEGALLVLGVATIFMGRHLIKKEG
ncbi:MAG: cytochrome c biogenesis protein CcsA [Planctomycetota bacterium]